jgi:DNA polymerase-3 subunit delta
MLESKFFVAGSDYFSVRSRCDAIIQSLRGVEIEIIPSDANNISEAIQELRHVCEALRTLSLFAEKKWVYYRDVAFLGDPSIGRSEGVLSWMEELQNSLEKLPQVGYLMAARSVDRRQKVIKWFLENCHGEIFEEPKLVGCERYVRDRVKVEGKKISAEALNQFLGRTGNDLAIIAGELDKLLLHVADESEIDARHVGAIVVDLRSDDFFETVELFFGDDVEAFARGIRRYFLYREEGRPLLAALQNRLRLLIQLRHLYEKDAMERVSKTTLEGLRDKYAPLFQGEVADIFTQNPWYLGKLLAIAKKASLGDWIDLQSELLNGIVSLSEHYGGQQLLFEKWYFQLRMVMASAEPAPILARAESIDS